MSSKQALQESLGLEPLLNLLNSLGGWPMTLESWNDDNLFSWQKTVATITRLYKTGILLEVFNLSDMKNTSQNIIYVSEASFVLKRAELLNPNSEKNKIAAYTTFITEAAKQIRDGMKSAATDHQIDKDVADMLNFEFALANITTIDEVPVNMEDFIKLLNPFSLKDFQSWTDNVKTATTYAKINWIQYLNDIYNFEAGINITENERIVATNPAYFQKLITLLNKTPLRTIANYMHWNLVHHVSRKTNQRMMDLSLQFAGKTTALNKNKICVDEANTFLGFAVGHANADTPPLDDKNDVTAMVTNVKTAFSSLLADATWINSDNKAAYKAKVDDMVSNIAYPDWIMNKESLESYYSLLSTSRMNYFGNYQNASAFLNLQTFKKLREDSNRGKIFEHEKDQLAAYQKNYNTIYISANSLRYPFYKRDRLAALNYGSIGFFIGHEIAHGFDKLGMVQLGTHGTSDWWDDTERTNYTNTLQCLMDQYGNYTSPSGMNLNAKITFNENVADNVGVRQAFRAYKQYIATNGVELKLPGLEEFTSEQFFFLGVNCQLFLQ
nr:EOG090X01U4 [Chydorus sphaericus]